MQRTFLIGFLAIILGANTLGAQNFAGDMALSKILIEGEDWVHRHPIGK